MHCPLYLLKSSIPCIIFIILLSSISASILYHSSPLHISFLTIFPFSPYLTCFLYITFFYIYHSCPPYFPRFSFSPVLANSTCRPFYHWSQYVLYPSYLQYPYITPLALIVLNISPLSYKSSLSTLFLLSLLYLPLIIYFLSVISSLSFSFSVTPLSFLTGHVELHCLFWPVWLFLHPSQLPPPKPCTGQGWRKILGKHWRYSRYSWIYSLRWHIWN